jgi:hypothetical protein
MYDLNGMRFKIEMAPTPEQEAEVKRKMAEHMLSIGMTPGPGGLYFEQKLLTIDEALEYFQMLKTMAAAMRKSKPDDEARR